MHTQNFSSHSKNDHSKGLLGICQLTLTPRQLFLLFCFILCYKLDFCFCVPFLAPLVGASTKKRYFSCPPSCCCCCWFKSLNLRRHLLQHSLKLVHGSKYCSPRLTVPIHECLLTSFLFMWLFFAIFFFFKLTYSNHDGVRCWRANACLQKKYIGIYCICI